MQIMKTVRYYHSLGAWTNKIGLRNPGILSLQGRKDISDKILSIHGFNRDEWMKLFAIIPTLQSPLALELNVSCPNVTDEKFNYEELFTAARKAHPLIIVKIPPVNYSHIVMEANLAGVNMFHCTNTLPVPVGGMSGKPLKRFALDAVATVRNMIPSSCIIGGGGIITCADIDDFVKAGANHVAIGSGLFNPYRALFGVKKLAQHSIEKLSSVK